MSDYDEFKPTPLTTELKKIDIIRTLTTLNKTKTKKKRSKLYHIAQLKPFIIY